jgi:hypothetical protein
MYAICFSQPYTHLSVQQWEWGGETFLAKKLFVDIRHGMTDLTWDEVNPANF